jgi:hypothetical protein
VNGRGRRGKRPGAVGRCKIARGGHVYTGGQFFRSFLEEVGVFSNTTAREAGEAREAPLVQLRRLTFICSQRFIQAIVKLLLFVSTT